MATEAKLHQLADRGCPVYYFYSSERYLVRQAVSAAVRILSADTDEETTVLDGAAPEIDYAVALFEVQKFQNGFSVLGHEKKFFAVKFGIPIYIHT